MDLTQAYWPRTEDVPVRATTAGGVLREAAARHPDRLALVGGLPDPQARQRWTFAELLGDAERAARSLSGRFSPGERIAVWAPNLPEWEVLEFGAALAGLTLVTINPAFRPEELRYVLDQSQAAGIFMVSQFRSPMADYLEQVRPQLPALREAVLFERWDEFLASGNPDEQLPDVAPDDVVQIQYTSGTTGFPKGAMLTHRGLTNNARFYAERIGLRPGDVHVNPMPMFHTAGCSMGALGAAQAGAVHVPVLAFDPALVLELCETERSTALLGVPTMLIALMEHPDLARRDLSTLRCAVSGGSAVPVELVRRIEERLEVTFSIVYGTTECCPLITQTQLDDSFADRSTTLGRPMPQTEVMIADPVTGTSMAPGEVGELCARGYLVMAGYNGAPEATAAAIDTDGWYHTGDLASMDRRGYLSIEGRLKDMIIRGGENIYPREIEDLLFAHPDVAEVAVVGIPDERWGETVAAFVRLISGSTQAEDLSLYCREHLAAYKTPQTWVFLDAFPITPSGKIQKFKLRESLPAPAHETADR